LCVVSAFEPGVELDGAEHAGPVRVFISYAHDDELHEERVRGFWWFLRAHGVNARLDKTAAEQRVVWTDWMTQEVRDADLVLVIASPAYKRRAEGGASPGEGQGVQWEARQIQNRIYANQQAELKRVLPVVLPGGSAENIPLWLTPDSATYYVISEYTVAGAEKLLRVLLSQPGETEPPLGELPVLPPRTGDYPVMARLRGELDDSSLEDHTDSKTRAVITLLTKRKYPPLKISEFLEAAGLNPGRYNLKQSSRILWTGVVPDAARQGKALKLIARVIEEEPAFEQELEDQLQPPLTHPGGEHIWYCHDEDDPCLCPCYFFGPRASHAVIDRDKLRSGMQDLATDQYWILVISGQARSGKSHSWVLIDHLRKAGALEGRHRFVRVRIDDWKGEVTGEALASSLIRQLLGFEIELTPSREIADARTRKILDTIVWYYPQGDDVTRWIILDGLDRPGVQESARDVAKGLIALVDDGGLPQTRLIVTGLDPLEITAGHNVRLEEIPSIDTDQVRSFFAGVAEHLGRSVTPQELDECVAEVLGTGGPDRDLREVERAVVRLVNTRWVQGVEHGG
jgi:hypothetical protein